MQGQEEGAGRVRGPGTRGRAMAGQRGQRGAHFLSPLPGPPNASTRCGEGVLLLRGPGGTPPENASHLLARGAGLGYLLYYTGTGPSRTCSGTGPIVGYRPPGCRRRASDLGRLSP